ncbi:MAG: primosomal protein N' [Firmicutes bacterium]|nr:primosomal protein N' [Bacillota bacterium]
MHEYAEILIELISDAVDRPFDYRIPKHLLGKAVPGSAVRVPFGRRQYRGYLLRLREQPAVDPGEVREIISLEGSEPLLQKEQLALIHWMSHRFYCRKIEAVHAMLPALFREGRQLTPRVLTLTGAAEEASLSRAPQQRNAVELLRKHGPLMRRDLLRLGVRSDTVRVLLKKGLLQEIAATATSIKVETLFPSAESRAATRNLDDLHDLKEEQQRVFEAVSAALDGRRAEKMLLHGVTASGKTEIYLQGIARCLEQQRGALVLLPEISLTPQMIELFAGRFPGKVAMLHSRLTPAERAEQWQRIRLGAAPVVLGARSAVFAPLKKIGFIVIDEEHENSYKQEEAPRYHAREVAWWRARYHGAPLLLGSATPSLESYFEAAQGRSRLLQMRMRVTPMELPPVTVVDMREELRRGNRQIFSRLLLDELEGILQRGEQALLFLNRRGFAGFVLCRECGFVLRCPHCAVSLTLHLDRAQMVCHYCSHEEPIPQTCPECKGARIRHFSAGTQRVEKEIKKLYPQASLVRMDSDTTAQRGAHGRLYRHFREGKAHIMIGTQMIAKGFDFPRVTLVGVVAADTILNLPDFRAAERTFQLLTQVSGRAGRGSGEGKVIIQTYHPGHYSIEAAARHDYHAFYSTEIELRKALLYPPFTDLVRFLLSGSDESALWEAAGYLRTLLENWQGKAELLGPARAPLYRLKKVYRVHIMVKGESLASSAHHLRKIAQNFRLKRLPGPVRLTVDFNPLMVL